MRKLFICLAVIMALTMVGGRSFALTFGDGGVGLQTVLNDITIGPNYNVSSVNVLTDDFSDTDDSYWSIHASGGSVSTVIIELAAWAGTNTFGIYDAANPANRVEVFDSTATAGSQALLSIMFDGSVWINFADTGVDFGGNVFGYYLDATVNTGQVWYSDTSLNADNEDHMVTYQGKNIDTIQISTLSPGIWDEDEHILAFEELHRDHWFDGTDPNYSDFEPNYSDFVLIVESIDPSLDECPDDPNKIEQGICGCGVPDTDTDGDGTPDCIDECPDDPNKIEQGICGCGVPDTDTDGDGIADCIPEPSMQIFPYPGLDPRALGWVGFPFTPGFTAGVPSTFISGYAPGLSIPSFPGTHTGFVYPGWMYPAWTSFVPRFPATFPILGIFSPVGRGWHVDYWTGYPHPSLSQKGWFYANW